jgi:thiosulfate reductase cytochrome b subunit
MTLLPTPSKPRRQLDPVVRLTHWVGAAAMICMILSGWQIFNASPILPFLFPAWATLGGWLGGAIAWHISAMWVLMADGLVYLVWGLASGHFRRDWLPVTASAVRRDASDALHFRLNHDIDRYNAVQKLLYWMALGLAVLAVATGLSIWKPVQLGWLTWVFGGYDIARRIHFAVMTGIVAFVSIHIALVALVPSTLLRMTIGVRPRATQPEGAPK